MFLTKKISNMIEREGFIRKLYFTYHENKFLVWILFSLIFIRTFFVSYYHIPTSSMNPNLMEGDMVVVNKLAYNIKLPFTDVYFKLNSPSRGDIVTFDYNGINMVKRVVAVSGDTIQFNKNRVYVNGKIVKLKKSINGYVENKRFEKQKHYLYTNYKETNHNGIEYDVNFGSGLSDEYLQQLILTTKEIKVPEDRLFMLGDNRNFSKDSRYLGTIHQKDIISEVTVVIFNYKEVWSFIKGELSGLRFFISLS